MSSFLEGDSWSISANSIDLNHSSEYDLWKCHELRGLTMEVLKAWDLHQIDLCRLTNEGEGPFKRCHLWCNCSQSSLWSVCGNGHLFVCACEHSFDCYLIPWHALWFMNLIYSEVLTFFPQMSEAIFIMATPADFPSGAQLHGFVNNESGSVAPSAFLDWVHELKLSS